jgi:hypothetical protein
MTKPRWISRFSILVLAAPLIGLPAISARAEEPTTEAEARDAAKRSQELAEHYDSLGGVGYKTGLVQRNEADARRYSQLADELAAKASSGSTQQPVPSPSTVPNL